MAGVAVCPSLFGFVERRQEYKPLPDAALPVLDVVHAMHWEIDEAEPLGAQYQRSACELN